MRLNKQALVTALGAALFFGGWAVRFSGDYSPGRLVAAGILLSLGLLVMAISLIIGFKK